jgi:hypothetical protein
MKEQGYYNKIRAEHSKNGVLFRNNTGVAYQGIKKYINSQLVITQPRIIEFGLIKGSSDLIGWTELEITPQMVGTKVAVFTAVEVKTESGKVSKEQQNFINNVNKAGGIGKITRV